MESRRMFLMKALGVLSLGASFSSAFGAKADLFEGFAASSSSAPGAGEAILVKPGMSYFLPATAKDGDYLQFIVDRESLKEPAIINNLAGTIAGEPDPLIMDSLAIFRLTYCEKTKDWKIS